MHNHIRWIALLIGGAWIFAIAGCRSSISADSPNPALSGSQKAIVSKHKAAEAQEQDK